MPTYFQKPENALKRADEFIGVDKKQRALDALYDVIKSKKHRTWQKTHEPIMEKYLSLCVELRKSHIAKEGLYQYKNICQQVNISSLVEVVKNYISLAEEKTEAARKESHQTVVDIDDLDLPESPESLLLKAVSGEDLQDRTDRAILTPWVKFLWESYRQCLDLLRNNSRVERLYQDIAQQAFKFCLKYTRKTEFRKLCDNLRTHLGHIHKHQHQQTAINLNNPESQSMHLETRLVQLDSAISMELWQEAFKAVEDIYDLISMSKKPPKPSLMANYYQKLGLVFAKSGNHLFHACTLQKLFSLSREQRKNLSQEELQKMASRVLCATLAVPIPPSRNVIGNLLVLDESALEKQRKLAKLLMLQTPPTRQSLVKDLVKNNCIPFVQQELQQLYQYLEVDFQPLSLYKKVKPIIEVVEKNEDLCQYVTQLEDIIVTRVLKQVAQVYQQIKFSRFSALVPFTSEHRLEGVIVDAAKTMELQVRIDHRTRALSFGTDLGVSQKEDIPEGPYIQSMPSEQIRNQVINMAQALNQAMEIIGPKESSVVEEEELKAAILNTYRLTAKKEHTRILQRRQIIENRKEQLEQNQDQREREEYEQVEESRRKAYEAEMARLEREAEERSKQRQQEEHEQIKRRHVKERLDELRKTPQGSKILQNIDEEEIAELDVDEIMAKQVEQLEKEKKELQERLKGQEKKVDYLARAKRLEELPLLLEQYEEDQKARKIRWEEQEKERIENMKTERDHALKTKARLSMMKVDLDAFTSTLKKAKKSEYEDKLRDFERLIADERRKRMHERKQNRKSERRAKWIQEQEEAAQRARDEKLKREREEQERLEQEQREEEERLYMEKKAKLDEQMRKQALREKEIEEREAKRREELAASRDTRGLGREGPRDGPPREIQREEGEWRRGDRDSAPRDAEPSEPKTWRPKTGGGGWREREKEKAALGRDGPRRRDDDERDPPRDDVRGPPRDDFRRDDFRRDDRDNRGPPRDIRRDDRIPRDIRDDRGPRDMRDDRGPRDVRDDRGPRDFDRGPRDYDRGPRDFDRGPRDFDRGPRDFDRGPRDFDRGGRDGRDDSWRSSRDGPPREIRRDGPPREIQRERDSWRDRGADRRDDRGPPGRDDWRGGERGPPREIPSRQGGGGWRDRQDEARGPRDDGPRRGEDGGSTWRRGGPPERDERRDDRRVAFEERGPRREDGPPASRSEKPAPQGGEQVEDDGWTTVINKK